MKKLKKASKKLKRVNEIPKFSDKHGFDLFKIKKCWKYYFKKTKRNVSSALDYTLNYIDQCYMVKQYSPKMDDEEKLKNKRQLLIRFDELNKTYKYSYSIAYSVVCSFLVSFLLMLLQISINKKPSYFEQSLYFINKMIETLANIDVIILLILFPLFIPVIVILLAVPFSIIIITCLISYLLYYSNYRNMIVPYERKIVLKTLQSYDGRYKELD